jgi:hypothetical protein
MRWNGYNVNTGNTVETNQIAPEIGRELTRS